jgi:hypothetical protein
MPQGVLGRCRAFVGDVHGIETARQPQPEMRTFVGLEKFQRAAVAFREFPRDCQSESAQPQAEAARSWAEELRRHPRRQARSVVGNIDYNALRELTHMHPNNAEITVLLCHPDGVVEEIETIRNKSVGSIKAASRVSPEISI